MNWRDLRLAVTIASTTALVAAAAGVAALGLGASTAVAAVTALGAGMVTAAAIGVVGQMRGRW